MRNNLGISDALLADALEIASKQRKRNAEKFKPGSAARSELESEAAQIDLARNTVLAGEPTPIEKAAAKR